MEDTCFTTLCGFLPYISMHQPEAYTCPQPREPASHHTSHPSRASQSTELSSLHYTATSHQLSILHMVTYTFQCYSLNSSHPLLPLLCPQVCSLSMCLYSWPSNRFITTILLDSIYIYALIYDIFSFLTYFSLYNRL